MQTCELFTGGLFVMPCYMPFFNLPPIFLASFFGTLIGIILLIRSCNQQPPEGHDDAAPSTPNPSNFNPNLSTTVVGTASDL